MHTGASWRVNKNFIAGAGLGWDWASLDAKSVSLLSSSPPSPFPSEYDTDSTADGDNYSANVGFLWFPTEAWSIGGVWRSQTDIDFDGTVTLTSPADVEETRNFDMELTFPQSVSVGACYKGVEMWLFSAQVDWTGWSSMDTLVQKLDSPISLYSPTRPFSTVTDEIVITRNWSDTYTFRLGAERQLSPDLALRAGYMWDPTPVPGETLDPLMFDVSTHRFSVGLGYTCGDWEVNGAYMYSQGQTEEAEDSENAFPTDGDYSGKSHVAEVSLIYHF